MAFPEARPTVYRGVQMRSRLEATFAADLDATRVRWKYEPRCYADGPLQYLPDFELSGPATSRRIFIEVKPTLSDQEDVCRRMEVIHASEPDAILWLVCPPEQDGLFLDLDLCDQWLTSEQWNSKREAMGRGAV